MKRLVFLLLFSVSCAENTEYLSLEVADWCFIEFQDTVTFHNYIANHEKYAEEGNPSSMRLLGCAYYQQGNILLAEQWLTQAYEQGKAGSAAALTAIYLKEGDLGKAGVWSQNITLETDLVRWLRVIDSLERYRVFEDVNYLTQAQTALKSKLNYEGETDMTVNWLGTITDLIQEEQKCQQFECSEVNFKESKQNVYIFSKGILSMLVPANPLKWNFESEEEPGAMNDAVAYQSRN